MTTISAFTWCSRPSTKKAHRQTTNGRRPPKGGRFGHQESGGGRFFAPFSAFAQTRKHAQGGKACKKTKTCGFHPFRRACRATSRNPPSALACCHLPQSSVTAYAVPPPFKRRLSPLSPSGQKAPKRPLWKGGGAERARWAVQRGGSPVSKGARGSRPCGNAARPLRTVDGRRRRRGIGAGRQL